MADKGLCGVCGTQAKSLCSRCKQAAYCTAEHQKKHWKQHRQACIPHGAALVRKGILLPADSEIPEIVHVACEVAEPEDDYPEPTCHLVRRGEFIGPASAFRRFYGIEFERFGPPSRRLSQYLQLGFNDEFLVNGSRSNKCVRALVPDAPHDWRGNMLVMKNVGQTVDGEFEDATLADLGPVKGYLSLYGINR
ncbi:unnamed protein product [Peniophora sp. CBMAI 1063]|nr:unnamed protein product [Peniophora sp. CBMAI 1063]